MRVLALVVLFLPCVAISACGGDSHNSDLSVAQPDYATPSETDGGVACGAVKCHAELSQICCIEPSYEYCGSSEACSAGIALYCDGPADCSGGVCCQTSASTVSCAQSCSGTLVCQVDADCPSATPSCCGSLGSSSHKTCAATCN